MGRSIARFRNLHAHLSRILLPTPLPPYVAHYSLLFFSLSLLFFLTYAHSETHGRSCKKIKEKAIVSVGGSFLCRSRSMAHEVADTCNIHTRAHIHMCTYTYIHIYGLRLGSAITSIFMSLSVSFFFIFWKELLSHLSLHCTLLWSAFEIR